MADPADEAYIKSCCTMKELRKKASNEPNLKQNIMSSVQPCIDILNERLQRIEFGDSTIEKAETASEAELHHFFRHILKIDDTMTPDITTKQQLSRHPKLLEWEKVHDA